MRLLLLTMAAIALLLAACQTESENDPPVVNPADCQPRALDAGFCGK